jgi:hypothetical protein
MSRRRQLVALLSVGALCASTAASADAPNQTDVTACSQEAAAASGHQGDSARHRESRTVRHDVGSASAPDTPTDGQSHSLSGVTGPASGSEAPGDAALRQAFAACLAKHGYYKGYYH